MSNPKLKKLIPHDNTPKGLLDLSSEVILKQGDGEDNANAFRYATKKYKKLHSEKVLEIGRDSDSLRVMLGYLPGASIIKAHSEKVSKNGNGELNSEAMGLVNRWLRSNSGLWAKVLYPQMMSAHSKRVLEVGNTSDNVNALYEAEHIKDLWEPHWDKILESGNSHDFADIIIRLRVHSNSSKICNGKASTLIKQLVEQLSRTAYAEDNIEGLKCALEKDPHDALSNRPASQAHSPKR